MNINNSLKNIHINKHEDSKKKYINKDISQVKAEDTKDIAIKNEILRLEIREKEIIKHEETHMLVGGNLAGSPSYIYINGPDGKRYISGGQVDMKMPKGGNLESLLNGLKRIKSAATAVNNPSGTDLQTAATTSAIEASILKEITLKKRDEAFQKSKELNNKPEISKDMSQIEQMIEKSFVSKLSTIEFKTMSKFELLI